MAVPGRRSPIPLGALMCDPGLLREAPGSHLPRFHPGIRGAVLPHSTRPIWTHVVCGAYGRMAVRTVAGRRAAARTTESEHMDAWARGCPTVAGGRPQPAVRSHDHVGGAGVFGAHPGSGYKMQLLYRVLRVKLNSPNRRHLKKCLRGLGNLLLDSGHARPEVGRAHQDRR